MRKICSVILAIALLFTSVDFTAFAEEVTENKEISISEGAEQEESSILTESKEEAATNGEAAKAEEQQSEAEDEQNVEEEENSVVLESLENPINLEDAQTGPGGGKFR